jgi:hypothetical protein
MQPLVLQLPARPEIGGTLYIHLYTHRLLRVLLESSRDNSGGVVGMVVPRWPAGPTLEAQRPALSGQSTSIVPLSRIYFGFQGGECNPADYH